MIHEDFVYHASKHKGLKRLRPVLSTHGKAYVYATKDLATSALFLSGLGGDFTCAIGRDRQTQKIYVCERFEGAFDLRYAQQSGVIYRVPKTTFLEGQTPWEEEVVSACEVVPVKALHIDDVKAFLLALEKEGAIKIVYYPEKIDGIPEDDGDLIERAVMWSKTNYDQVYVQLKQYHPRLVPIFLERINKS